MMRPNSRGLSVISIVLALLILSLFGAVAASIVGTQASLSIQEEQGLQALFIAEGGLRYAFKNGTYCNYNGISGALGEGNFSVASVNSTAAVSGSISGAATTIYLTAVPQIGFSNGGFSIPGVIGIDSEYIFCTTPISNSFTGCTRGYGGSTAASHINNAVIKQCSVKSEGTVSTGLGFGRVKRVIQTDIIEVEVP